MRMMAMDDDQIGSAFTAIFVKANEADAALASMISEATFHSRNVSQKGDVFASPDVGLAWSFMAEACAAIAGAILYDSGRIAFKKVKDKGRWFHRSTQNSANSILQRETAAVGKLLRDVEYKKRLIEELRQECEEDASVLRLKSDRIAEVLKRIVENCVGSIEQKQ